MRQFSTWSAAPEMKRIPDSPVLSPSMLRPRNVTTSLAPAWTTTPFVPDTRTPAISPSLMMLIALVMVTAPKPPGSRTLISPAGAVFEMAPAKVLHGAVRLHGLASSPTPETQVRVAWAWAGVPGREMTSIAPRSDTASDMFLMATPSKKSPAPTSPSGLMARTRASGEARITGPPPGGSQLIQGPWQDGGRPLPPPRRGRRRKSRHGAARPWAGHRFTSGG